MKIVSLIPARSGSKRLENKNIRKFNGRPLIYWTFSEVMKSNIEQNFLTTDCEKIISIAKTEKITVPFIRPKNLCLDKTLMFDVVNHFYKWSQKNYLKIDAVVLLQPTSPLRQYLHINKALEKFKNSNCDTLVSVVKAGDSKEFTKVMEMNSSHLLKFKRFDTKNLFIRNGPSILITKIKNLERGDLYGKKIIPFEMQNYESVDIDTEEDFFFAEFLHKKIQNR